MKTDETLISIFLSIVKCCPDHRAIFHNSKSIVYKELDAASNCIAALIQKKISSSCAIIALYLPPGIEAITVMLGILKAGHTYLFLDINDPQFRIDEILDSAKPDMVVFSDVHESNFKNRNIQLLNTKTVFDFIQSDEKCLNESCKCICNWSLKSGYLESALALQPSMSLKAGEPLRTADSTAYVIYTSGSTGRPKGIPIKDRAVLNLIKDFQQRSFIDSKDNCSLWTNLNFDVSVYEIWSALLSGATLFIPDQKVRLEPGKFINWLAGSGITSAYIPPFMIEELAEHQMKNPAAFKRILTGVEPVPETLLCRLKQNTPHLCLINGYGPAEATVCATLYEIPDSPANPGNAPIGKPVQNLRVYLLDQSGIPVEDGKKGEIYISGVQVADRYLNEPVLSEKSFLKNTFSNGLSEKMYKTGDLGIRLKSGDILFSGRKDFQIKLRGFRIEPGEIENIIKEFSGISQAAVVLKKNSAGRELLTAYIDSTSDLEQLTGFLKTRLPKYMVPSIIISLENMPLTSQDKIDKKDLIKRDDLTVLNKELPRTKQEKIIAGIWEEFLKISPIYRNDDFLLLGGDSISGIKIVSRLNTLYKKEIEINTLFDHSRLNRFAELFAKSKIRNKKTVWSFFSISNKKKKKKSSALLYDQHLIWLFEQINPGTYLYHIPLVYNIRGSINFELLKQSIKTIKNRHIALKSRFLIKNEKPFQKLEFTLKSSNDKCNENCSITDISKNINNRADRENLKSRANQENQKSSLTTSETVNQWIVDKARKKFNLETGPLFRSDILITGKRHCVLCLTFHHIVFDGWSAGLFIKELGEIYSNLVKNRPLSLPGQEFTYYDYVSSQNFQVAREWKKAEKFFRSYLKDLPETRESSASLKKDFPETGETPASEFAGTCFPVKIEESLYNKIKQIALENNTTAFTVVLTFFQILLSAYTENRDQITGIAYAGRDRIETESMIGFLMNTLVVRNIFDIDQSFTSSLAMVKQTLEKIFKFKNIPFQKIIQLCQKTNQSTKLLGSMFLMQTMELPELDLNGAESEYLHPDLGKANCDITLELFEEISGLNGWFEYRTDVFSEKRVKRLAQQFNQIIKIGVEKPELNISHLLHVNHFPLLPMQQTMVQTTVNAPLGAGVYNEQIVFDVGRELDIQRFTKAWQKIIRNYENLRLGFTWKCLDQPFQYILSFDELDFKLNFLNANLSSETESFLEMFLKADKRAGFDPGIPPLFRVTLLKKTNGYYSCIWSLHHAVADRKTMVLILKDLFLTYSNPEFSLVQPGSFKDHAVRLNKLMNDSRANAATFWKKELKDFPPPLDLPFKFENRPVEADRRTVQHFRRTAQHFAMTTKSFKTVISSAETSILEKICRENSITMNAMLMGAWTILLSHYTGKNDIVFGFIGSKTEKFCPGMNINLIPVRIKLDPLKTLFNFLKNIENKQKEINRNSNILLDKILAAKGAEDSKLLFNTVFFREENSIEEAFKECKDQIINCNSLSLHERLPASLFLNITGKKHMTLNLAYDRRRFDAETVAQISGHFRSFLHSVVEEYGKNKQLRLTSISILTRDEKKKIAKKLCTFENYTRPDSCIHNLIEIQTYINKDRPAVLMENKSLTHRELNLYANQIAGYLIKKGAAPETKTVILLNRNAGLTAALLGVLKSGSAYVPVDPEFNDETINYIIKDSAPEFIITSENHKPRIEPGSSVIILLDKNDKDIKKMDAANPKTGILPENMAYILYNFNNRHGRSVVNASATTNLESSATAVVCMDSHIKTVTGIKKYGVVVEHRSLAAFIRAASEIYDMQPGDKILQMASVSSREAIEEIFPALYSGAALVIKPEVEDAAPAEIMEFCKKNSITILFLSTPKWHQLVDALDTVTLPGQIRTIIIGKERAAPDKVEKWNSIARSDIRVVNTYGRAETTGAVAFRELASISGVIQESESEAEWTDKETAIGTLFPNICLCILNQFHQPAFPGTRGELYVGGIQTARGYLSRDRIRNNNSSASDSSDAATFFNCSGTGFVKLKVETKEKLFFKTGEIL